MHDNSIVALAADYGNAGAFAFFYVDNNNVAAITEINGLFALSIYSGDVSILICFCRGSQESDVFSSSRYVLKNRHIAAFVVERKVLLAFAEINFLGSGIRTEV